MPDRFRVAKNEHIVMGAGKGFDVLFEGTLLLRVQNLHGQVRMPRRNW